MKIPPNFQSEFTMIDRTLKITVVTMVAKKTYLDLPLHSAQN